MQSVSLQALTQALMNGKIAEFSWHGEDYLIQQENNKGWDYLSIWRTSGSPVCLGRALFDIYDGASEETVQELIQVPCMQGRTLEELFPEIRGVDIR